MRESLLLSCNPCAVLLCSKGLTGIPLLLVNGEIYTEEDSYGQGIEGIVQPAIGKEVQVRVVPDASAFVEKSCPECARKPGCMHIIQSLSIHTKDQVEGNGCSGAYFHRASLLRTRLLRQDTFVISSDETPSKRKVRIDVYRDKTPDQWW